MKLRRCVAGFQTSCKGKGQGWGVFEDVAQSIGCRLQVIFPDHAWYLLESFPGVSNSSSLASKLSLKSLGAAQNTAKEKN